MEKRPCIMALSGLSLAALLWLVHVALPRGGRKRENAEVVLFMLSLAFDLLGIILGLSAVVREGRSRAAWGGVVGGLAGLVLLALVLFVIVGVGATPR